MTYFSINMAATICKYGGLSGGKPRTRPNQFERPINLLVKIDFNCALHHVVGVYWRLVSDVHQLVRRYIDIIE